jgi:heme exporter protein CcmD
MPNLDLGKYALYILPPYIISILAIAGMAADSLLRARRWKREVERRESARGDKRSGKDKKAAS